jgi:hypothetical protein
VIGARWVDDWIGVAQLELSASDLTVITAAANGRR